LHTPLGSGSSCHQNLNESHIYYVKAMFFKLFILCMQLIIHLSIRLLAIDYEKRLHRYQVQDASGIDARFLKQI
jgi:hypothetical protein